MLSSLLKHRHELHVRRLLLADRDRAAQAQVQPHGVVAELAAARVDRRLEERPRDVREQDVQRRRAARSGHVAHAVGVQLQRPLGAAPAGEPGQHDVVQCMEFRGDNGCAEALVKSGCSSKMAAFDRALQMRVALTHDLRGLGLLKVVRVSSKRNAADAFTKPFSRSSTSP